MNVQVTSASKREQKLSRVAAAIFVITQEDIRHSGARNIPDLLHIVPGLDVAQINNNTWAISSRGFNGQYSNKLLVLVDGRVVYTPTFAGVFWDVQDVPLENVERIEVIRGPGGTVWGANAVNGVISIFTKKAGETPGVMIVGGAGTTAQGFGTVQYGGKLTEGTEYRAYTKYFNDSHLVGLSGQNGGDGWHLLSSGFRTDSALSPKDQLMVAGTLYTGREGLYGIQLDAITPAAMAPAHDDVNLGGGAIQSVWNHSHSDRSDSTLQVSFNRYRRGNLEPERRDTIDLDYQYRLALGQRNNLVSGASYNYTSDDIQGTFAVSFLPPRRTLQVFTAFLQDEVALIPNRLYLTAGTKLEHNDYTGFDVMPSVRLAWEPGDHHMFWAAISRALRTPSRADTDATSNVASVAGPQGTSVLIRYFGNPDFQNEELSAYEAGYRATISNLFSIDLAACYNDYQHLQTTEPGMLFFEPTPLPAHFVEPILNSNLMHGETHGVEIAANWKVTGRWTLTPGYAFERIHLHTDPASRDPTTPAAAERGAPDNSAQLRSHFDFSRDLGWDISAYFVDRLSNQGIFSTTPVPAYTRLDTGVTWTLTQGFSVSLVGQNLLQDHHVEFQGSLGSVRSSEIKRNAYVKFTWQF